MATVSRLEDARQMLALVREFSPDAKIILDPSSAQEFGQVNRDDDLGINIIEPTKDTAASAEGPFCLYGHIGGFNLAIPALDANSQDYTIRPGAKHVFIQNVGDFKADFELNRKKAAGGHPLFNNGIKYGTNIVARGDDGNKVVVLLWSSRKYNELQERA